MLTGILYWETGAGTRWWVIEPGYYIGRIDPGEEIPGPIDPFETYIYRPHGPVVPTGIDDPRVSRNHVLITEHRGLLAVVDHGHRGRGSRHGTYVNDKRIPPGKPHVVSPGDRLRLGPETVFIVGVMGRHGPLIYLPRGEAVLPRGLAEAVEGAVTRVLHRGIGAVAVIDGEGVVERSGARIVYGGGTRAVLALYLAKTYRVEKRLRAIGRVDPGLVAELLDREALRVLAEMGYGDVVRELEMLVVEARRGIVDIGDVLRYIDRLEEIVEEALMKM